MTWYIKSQEQQNFFFMDDSTKLNSPETLHSTYNLESLEILCEEISGELGIESALIKYGYSFEKIVFPERKYLFVINITEGIYVIPDPQDPWPVEAEDWIYNLDFMELYDFYPDFIPDFWEGVNSGSSMYHGTYEEKIEDIKISGLEPRNETRGIENRHTGSGIFMSESQEKAEEHYPIVIEVLLGKMKEAGYTPEMGQEEPIVEANLRNTLANRLGLEEFWTEAEQGLFEDTVICRGIIPSEYLNILD